MPKTAVNPNLRLVHLIEDAFPCSYCGQVIGLGQWARTRRSENRRIAFFHPACPRRVRR